MRWTLLALLGVALIAAGVVGFVLELVHGNDIWSRHAWGFALLASGLYCVWRGLSERASGSPGKPLWPAVALFAVLAGAAVALYAIAPPAAVLFAILVLPLLWGARVQGWFSSD